MIFSLTAPIYSFAGNFRPDSEPDGFRGMKWGDDIDKQPNQEFIFKDGKGPNKDYIKKHDDLTIGLAHFETIEYCFWDGKFYMVQIKLKGRNNIMELTKALFIKFGKVYNEYTGKYKNDIFNYNWEGNVTGISYIYGFTSNNGTLLIASKSFQKILKEYWKEEN
jgi:hypothetical protein